MAKLNANMFPEVYKDLGVDTRKLGCIMLDVQPFPVISKVHDAENDIYTHPDQENHPYTGGAPVETTAHCTLLYGLMEPGEKWKKQVDAVLDGWTPPDLEIERVDAFPSNLDGEDYSVIVAKIKVTPELLEGNQRLQLLPHVNTFPEYQPHVTLAYIKNGPSGVEWASDAKDKWIQTLNIHLAERTLDVTGINYGSDD